MVGRGYLAHESPEGRNWVERLARAGVEGFAMAGENVGLTSKPRPEPARSSRAGSTRRSIARTCWPPPYNATGVGIARAADGRLYYTQLYLTLPALSPRPLGCAAASPRRLRLDGAARLPATRGTAPAMWRSSQ